MDESGKQMVDVAQRNLYYYDRTKIDLAKLRSEAVEIASGKYWSSKPAVAVIHYHDSAQSCKDENHERYTPTGDPAAPFAAERFVAGAERIL